MEDYTTFSVAPSGTNTYLNNALSLYAWSFMGVEIMLISTNNYSILSK
jgi:hypothetical protein